MVQKPAECYLAEQQWNPPENSAVLVLKRKRMYVDYKRRWSENEKKPTDSKQQHQ
jgi:hypothetical protein